MVLRHFLVIMFGLYSISNFSQSVQPLIIDYTSSNIKIDGVLDEDTWNGVSFFDKFYNHFPIDEGISQNKVDVKLFHDGKNLYVGLTYFDSVSRNNISTLKRDNYEDGVFLSDCMGIVLDPYNNGDNGYVFAVNAGGVQYDGLIGNATELDGSWNTVWQSEASSNGNEKYYELAIPLDAINFDHKLDSWRIQVFVNDTKINQFTTANPVPRNFGVLDLRYAKSVNIRDLPQKVTNKYSILPALTVSSTTDLNTDDVNQQAQLSLDGQYNITPALRLDLTLNPDFSQVEVDQQVTNLSRFAINFPERRKFFLENSDLFNSLGSANVTPFNSRQVGATTGMLFGAKLSGNIGTNTRLGIQHSVTKDVGEINGSTYTVGVLKHNISQAFNSSAYVVNTSNTEISNNVIGTNLNYRSKNNRWTSDFNYGRSITDDVTGKANYIAASINYDTRAFTWETSYERVEENYIAQSGFVPQQYNFNALTEETIREGFSELKTGFRIKNFPKDSKKIDWINRFWIRNFTTFNQDNSLRSNLTFWSPFAIRFKDRSYVYVSSVTTIDELQYSFDFLENGNVIMPNRYIQTYGRVGYWTPPNDKFSLTAKFEYGQFYGGTRLNPDLRISYRLLPSAVLSASYIINDVDMGEIGAKTFHLIKLTSEIYFNKNMNWTTFFQYNTQQDNFNINSRLQWEYKPLSFVYLVLTNNYNNEFLAKNWGVSLKVNRRFDF